MTGQRISRLPPSVVRWTPATGGHRPPTPPKKAPKGVDQEFSSRLLASLRSLFPLAPRPRVRLWNTEKKSVEITPPLFYAAPSPALLKPQRTTYHNYSWGATTRRAARHGTTPHITVCPRRGGPMWPPAQAWHHLPSVGAIHESPVPCPSPFVGAHTMRPLSPNHHPPRRRGFQRRTQRSRRCQRQRRKRDGGSP